MNLHLITKWNNDVSKNDEIFILGDFSLGTKEETITILEQLNGRKYLILGNHDEIIRYDSKLLSYFEWVRDYAVIRRKGMTFVLSHFPIADWKGKQEGFIHLYGHIHSGKHRGALLVEKTAFNVGVDVNHFKPVCIKEIIECVGSK